MLANAALAVPVQWTFQNVVFDDGATLTGGFVFDVDSDTVYVVPQQHFGDYYAQAFYFDVNITFTPSTEYSIFNDLPPIFSEDYVGPYLGEYYDLAGGGINPVPPANADSSSYENGLDLVDEPVNPIAYVLDQLSLTYAAPLTNAGGIVDISGFQERDVVVNGSINPPLYAQRTIVSGTLVGVSVVPVPAAVWLFGSGLLSLGYFRKEQNSRVPAVTYGT